MFELSVVYALYTALLFDRGVVGDRKKTSALSRGALAVSAALMLIAFCLLQQKQLNSGLALGAVVSLVLAVFFGLHYFMPKYKSNLPTAPVVLGSITILLWSLYKLVHR